MTALFDEPIKAWANGKQVLWLGVDGPTPFSDDQNRVAYGGFSLVNHTDGTTEWVPTQTIQTDWRYDDKKGRWIDASLAPTDDGDTDEQE